MAEYEAMKAALELGRVADEKFDREHRGEKMTESKRITPIRIREIYAEELRKLGESNRAERVLDGSDTNAVSLAAIKALHRVADEAPQVAVFDALKARLDEVGREHTAESEACDMQRASE
jgi:hypothetical protein